MTIPAEIVVFDLETTGLDPWQDRIIEIGAVRLVNGEERETFRTFVDPRGPLPREITSLTGITPEDLIGAPLLAEALPRFLEFAGNAPLAAHNAEGFDRQFLERALGRRLPNPVLDTLPFAFLARPQAPSHSLAALARDLPGGGGGAHRALDDARDLARVLSALLADLARMPEDLRAEAALLLRATSWPWKGVVCEGAAERTRFSWTRRNYAPTKKIIADEDPEAWKLQPVDLDAVGGVFRAGGAVSREKPGFEERPQQVEMARSVGFALNDGSHLAVEAGTGVGKSYAYLIPALQWGHANRRPVVVSTFTKVLQAQLAADVPTIEKVLGRPIRVAIVKGRSNYLCLHKWEDWHEGVRQGQGAVPGTSRTDEMEAPVVAAMVHSWEERTASGDAREELPWWLVSRAQPDLLARVTIDAEHCPGLRCPLAQNCFVTMARRKALDADLVIVNHRLLLESYLAGRDDLLPPNPVLVIDEAHHLEGVATDVLARESSYPVAGRALNEVDDPEGRGALRRVIRLVKRNEAQDVSEAVERVATQAQDALAPTRHALAEFFGDLDAFVRTNATVSEETDLQYARRLRVTAAMRALPGWDLLRRQSAVVVAALRRLVAALRTFLQAVEPVAIEGPSRMELHRAALRSATDRLDGVAELHDAVFADLEMTGWVIWAESEPPDGQPLGRWTARLKAAPVEVGPALVEGLYTRVRSIVFTSATLTTSSRTDEFRFMRMRLGWDLLTPERLRTLRLDSPFDYEKQVLALTVVDLPAYESAREQRDAWLSGVAGALPKVLAANHGGTLVLCTSHEQVERLFPVCRERLEPLGITCLRQRRGQSIRQQIERFREDVDSVLFGTYSLWEGIDVPGEALDGLVILKLPFDPPDDPVIEARREAVDARGLSGMHYYYYPLAILRLRQGFGRLIRSSTDRGVCVVMDRRLAQSSNRYSLQFRNSLPTGVRFRSVSTEEAVSLIRKFVQGDVS